LVNPQALQLSISDLNIYQICKLANDILSIRDQLTTVFLVRPIVTVRVTVTAPAFTDTPVIGMALELVI